MLMFVEREGERESLLETSLELTRQFGGTQIGINSSTGK